MQIRVVSQGLYSRHQERQGFDFFEPVDAGTGILREDGTVELDGERITASDVDYPVEPSVIYALDAADVSPEVETAAARGGWTIRPNEYAGQE